MILISIFVLVNDFFKKPCLYNSAADTKYLYRKTPGAYTYLSLINGLYLFSNKIVKTRY